MASRLLKIIKEFFTNLGDIKSLNKEQKEHLNKLRHEAYTLTPLGKHELTRVKDYVVAVVKLELDGYDIGEHLTCAKNFDDYEIIFAKESERKLKKKGLI